MNFLKISLTCWDITLIMILVNVSLIPLEGKVSFLYWHIQIESFTQYLSINSFEPYGWNELFLCEKESN